MDGEQVTPTIEHLTLETAKLIYREYWEEASCDDVSEISPELALLLFDMAVNSGCTRAKKLLQQDVCTKDDGHVGPDTLFAIKQHIKRHGEDHLLEKYT